MDDKSLDRHIHLIYATVSDPALWHDCLRDIANTIDAKSGMIGVDDSKTKAHLSAIRYGFSPDQIEAMAPYKDRDVWVHKLLDLKATTFLFNEQFLPQKSYYHSDMFNGYAKYLDLHHTIGIYLDQNEDYALRMGFQRGQSQGSYSEIEVSYLDRLLPHIKRALSLSKDVLRNNFSQQMNQKIFEELSCCYLLVDSSGKLVTQNILAEKLLTNTSLIKTRKEHIVSISGINDSELKSTLASVTRSHTLETMEGSVPFLTSFSNNGHDEMWLIEISRYQQHQSTDFATFLNIRQDALAMIKFKELSKQPVNLPKKLHSLYQLSKSEASIALQLGKGLSPKEIAEERSRSIETIRTQIKQVMAKIGVKKSTELIALLNKLSF